MFAGEFEVDANSGRPGAGAFHFPPPGADCFIAPWFLPVTFRCSSTSNTTCTVARVDQHALRPNISAIALEEAPKSVLVRFTIPTLSTRGSPRPGCDVCRIRKIKCDRPSPEDGCDGRSADQPTLPPCRVSALVYSTTPA